jgi:2-oxoglutarate dehydrogenase E1 component
MFEMTEQSPSGRINRASNDILEATSFLSGTNAAFLEGLYEQYLANPGSVDDGWRVYFEELGEAGLTPTQLGRGPAWQRDKRASFPQDETTQALSGGFDASASKPSTKKADKPVDGESVRATALDSIRAIQLVRAYRVIGHLEADLDPLKITPTSRIRSSKPPSTASTTRRWTSPSISPALWGWIPPPRVR